MLLGRVEQVLTMLVVAAAAGERPADKDHRNSPAGDRHRGCHSDHDVRPVDTTRLSAFDEQPGHPERMNLCSSGSGEARELTAVESPAVGPTHIVFGAPVRCGASTVGKVADVLVDPVDRHLTHIVVRMRDKQVRRVPVDIVDLAGDHPYVALECTLQELTTLEPIRHFAYLGLNERPPTDVSSDVGVEDVLAVPLFEATAFGDFVGDFNTGVALTYDEIPKGKAELRRASAIRGVDGHKLGHVDGLILYGGGITHVVLEHGHLWRLRRVAIPIDAVDAIETDVVTVRTDTLPRDAVSRRRRSRPIIPPG
jgi:sporulation protein YlmC with PRC-barrel domain